MERGRRAGMIKKFLGVNCSHAGESGQGGSSQALFLIPLRGLAETRKEPVRKY
jgi:hypothetical protein